MFGLNLSSKFPFVKAVGELPVSVQDKRHNIADSNLDERSVQSDVLADFFLNTFSKLPPKEIESILRMSLSGNIWQIANLHRRMAESWPCLAKCEYEIRSTVANSTFVVHPYALPGEEPTESAKEKAELVRRTIEGMKPDRFADEDGWRGFLFDLTNAIMLGYSICELIWDENARDPKGNREKRIRSAAFVHPRHYTFFPTGEIGVAAVETTNDLTLTFPSQIRKLPVMNNPSKFVVAKFKNKSGSGLGAGFARVLAPIWVQVVYGRDFMLNFAQKYGNPFLDIPYQAGISEAEIAVFERLAKRAANQGYAVHPNSGEVKITPAQSMGGGNAHVELLKLADEACQMVMLGQTLTSAVSRDGGSRAQATVHADVKSERVENLLKWVAEILTEQFVESLMIENYGNSDERPHIEPDLTRPLDALEQAQFLTALSTCTVPLPMADTYKKLGVTAPSEGDQVLVSGKIGVLGATDTELEANPKDAPPVTYDANGMPLPNADGSYPEKPTPPQPQGASADDNNFTKASSHRGTKSLTGVPLRTLLATLPESDLATVKNLTLAAKNASHANGELTALNKKLFELAGGRK